MNVLIYFQYILSEEAAKKKTVFWLKANAIYLKEQKGETTVFVNNFTKVKILLFHCSRKKVVPKFIMF